MIDVVSAVLSSVQTEQQRPRMSVGTMRVSVWLGCDEHGGTVAAVLDML